jgi:hypothetical protein
MIEDKLEHDERLRLECVAQANMMRCDNSTHLVKVAQTIENYVKNGEVPR